MGIFDTIVFQKPIICKCGHKIESTQTKEFDCRLNIYRVGDMIPSAPIFALFEKFTYCDNCSANIEFFVACSYSVYLGIFQSYREAKETIDNFGMEELLKFYQKRVPPQDIFNDTPNRFMMRLVEFYESTPKKREEDRNSILGLHSFKEETPLEAIKNYLKQDELAREIKHLYCEKVEFDIEYKIVDSSYAEIYNQAVQKALGYKYLFKLVKIGKRDEINELEENSFRTFEDIDEKLVLDKIQEWIDVNILWDLRVIGKEL
jgi:hypothetical protein